MFQAEIDSIADQLSISRTVASDIWYLRTRSRWTQDLEDQLVKADKAGNSISSEDVLSGEWPYGEKEARQKKMTFELEAFAQQCKE